VVFVACCIVLSACSLNKSAVSNSEKEAFPYALAKLVSYELDSSLNEISGLCYDSSKDVLLAIEDEHGIIYTLDKVNGSIIQRDSFYKNGDYEGVAISKEYVFVLKSTGTIYKVDKSDINKKPTKVKSFLTKKFDTEGIHYDELSHALLICHKESTGDVSKNQRCVFRYDLQSEQMMEKPLFNIDREELMIYIMNNFSKAQVEPRKAFFASK